MINLNTIDVNELVLKLSNALFNVLDGVQDHDIKYQTGCTDDEVTEITEMRKIATEIAWENKFIPLDFNPKDDVRRLDNTGGDWYTNTGNMPVEKSAVVDVMFLNDATIVDRCTAGTWDWSVCDSSGDIQFWRYSKG